MRRVTKRKLRIAWSCGRVPGHEHATYEDALRCSAVDEASRWDPAVDVLEAANLRLAKRLAPKNPPLRGGARATYQADPSD